MKQNSETIPAPVSVRRDLGQNIFTIAFDVHETDGGYEFETQELTPGVWNRSEIIRAIIRSRYSADDMEAIHNNVLADLTDKDARDEHKAMQQWRQKAKQWSRELMTWAEENGIAQAELLPDPEPAQPDASIEAADGVATLSAAVELAKEQATDLEDEQAANLPDLFPLWADNIGQVLPVGKRYSYKSRLWKVIQEHTAQADWAPDIVPALFTEVVAQQQGDEPEPGTIDNPIPYNNNMELFEGMYYSQDGVVYRCIRSTGIPVYNPLAQLVGLYVEVVQ
jgi:hypothetical protein